MPASNHAVTEIKTLRLILGDQLSYDLTALNDINPDIDIVLMCEVWEEATYVKHHKKKIAFLFSAMRHFADELRGNGLNVHYTKLDDAENAGSFKGEIKLAIAMYKPQQIIVTFPGEYRVLQDMKSWHEEFGIPVEIRPDNRFLSSPEEFEQWADDRGNLRMEFFYREMRKKYDILMDDAGKPEGGEWNYDHENRGQKIPDPLFLPKRNLFQPDEITQDVLQLVAARFGNHFGDLEPFHFAVTREQALQVLNNFIEKRLPDFGEYQDVMVEGQPFLYHSHLSFYLNCGLLKPLEVIYAAEKAYYDGYAPINSVEGFIRQILGWREYVRGVYWMKMPGYETENFLSAKRKLPWLYWSGETEMNCMHHCVNDTKQHAYAHHIQRLMVLGNFALIAGIDPVEVNEWYLIVYADAYEWVELPNVSGMILFADGGFIASKPYAATGAYINKMSNYCKNCRYDVNKKNGPDACPFNYLYWNFMMENREKLVRNPRIGFSYHTLDNMTQSKRDEIVSDSAKFFKIIGQ